MPKIDLEEVSRALKNNNTDIQKINEIMADLKMVIQAEEEERANRPPPVKKQFVVALADADGALADEDITGWVLQIPEDDHPAGAERISAQLLGIVCLHRHARLRPVLFNGCRP